jgi:hypothetical protein
MQHANLLPAILPFLQRLLLCLFLLFLLLLLPEYSRGVLVLGVVLRVCEPKLVRYPVGLSFCPLLCCARLVNRICVAEPLQRFRAETAVYVRQLWAQIVHTVVGEGARGSAMVQDAEDIVALYGRDPATKYVPYRGFIDPAVWQRSNLYAAFLLLGQRVLRWYDIVERVVDFGGNSGGCREGPLCTRTLRS